MSDFDDDYDIAGIRNHDENRSWLDMANPPPFGVGPGVLVKLAEAAWEWVRDNVLPHLLCCRV
jgi:hypothetical protein